MTASFIKKVAVTSCILFGVAKSQAYDSRSYEYLPNTQTYYPATQYAQDGLFSGGLLSGIPIVGGLLGGDGGLLSLPFSLLGNSGLGGSLPILGNSELGLGNLFGGLTGGSGMFGGLLSAPLSLMSAPLTMLGFSDPATARRRLQALAPDATATTAVEMPSATGADQIPAPVKDNVRKAISELKSTVDADPELATAVNEMLEVMELFGATVDIPILGDAVEKAWTAYSEFTKQLYSGELNEFAASFLETMIKQATGLAAAQDTSNILTKAASEITKFFAQLQLTGAGDSGSVNAAIDAIKESVAPAA